MSGLSDFVNINISLSALAPQQAGFGIPGILSMTTPNGSWATAELNRTYSTLAALGVDFPTTSPEYLSGQRLFAQSPAPPFVVVFRFTVKATMQQKIQITYASGAHFAFTVNGTQVDVVGVTDNDTTITAIIAACPAISGVSYSATGSVGSKVVQVDCTAGTYVYINLVAASGQDTGPMGNQLLQLHCTTPVLGSSSVAAQIANARIQNSSWYECHNPYVGKAFQLAVSDAIESLDPPAICLHDEPDTDSIAIVVGSGTDWGVQAHTNAYVRTAGTFHQSPEKMFSIGWAGKILPLAPGSENWAYAAVGGVPGSALTDTHKVNLAARNMNWFITVGGTSRAFFGTTFSGIYLDIVRSRDWTKARMQERLFGLLAGAADRGSKVPFTDDAGVQIAGEINAVFLEGYANNVFVKGTGLITIPKVSSISPSDKAIRKFSGIRWSATLAGAVNTLDISGVISA